MNPGPAQHVRLCLARLEEAGLVRPASTSVKEWLGVLGGAEIVDEGVARQLAGVYEAARFGGNEPDAAAWSRLAAAFEEAVDAFEVLDEDKRGAIAEALAPAPNVSAPSPQPAARSAPRAARERPAPAPEAPDLPTATPRRTRRVVLALAGVLAVTVAATVFVLQRGDKESAARQHRPAAAPAPDVRLDGAAVTPPERLFRSRVELSHGGTGRSISVVDFDGDGDLDVFVPSDHQAALLENRGDRLVDVTAAMGLRGPARSGQWADIDGNGSLDLAVSSSQNPIFLFRRERAVFVFRALQPLRPNNLEGLGWIDHDSDGDPDLLVTNGVAGVHFILNDEGSLRDISDDVGFGARGWGRDNGDFVHFVDLDGDGRLDVLYAATTGLVARNVEGKRFEPVATDVQFAMLHTGNKQAMAVGDLDGDREAELFVPQPDRGRLYNRRDGAMVEVDLPHVHAAFKGRARSAIFGDVDLDGDLDLVVAMRGGGLELLENRDGALSRATARSGFAELMRSIDVVGMAMGDIDGDGDLDLAYHANGGLAGILLGDVGLPADRGMLRVDFATPPVPGTRIAVRGAQQRRWQTRWLGIPQNTGSQEPLRASFSLPVGTAVVEQRATDGVLACTSVIIEPGKRADLRVGPDTLSPCPRDVADK